MCIHPPLLLLVLSSFKSLPTSNVIKHNIDTRVENQLKCGNVIKEI